MPFTIAFRSSLVSVTNISIALRRYRYDERTYDIILLTNDLLLLFHAHAWCLISNYLMCHFTIVIISLLAIPLRTLWLVVTGHASAYYHRLQAFTLLLGYLLDTLWRDAKLPLARRPLRQNNISAIDISATISIILAFTPLWREYLPVLSQPGWHFMRILVYTAATLLAGPYAAIAQRSRPSAGAFQCHIDDADFSLWYRDISLFRLIMCYWCSRK